MKSIMMTLVASSLVAAPALAQPTDSGPPAEQRQMCEIMHNSQKMQGMMVRGEDGSMACQMMNHSQMDHNAMPQGQMDHGQMEHGESGHGHMNRGPASQQEGASAGEAAQPHAVDQDHTAHPGHAPS